jgi:antitoxin CcdA
MRTRAALKAPTNLSVRADLVRSARKHGINLSEFLEHALDREIGERERQAWLAENEDAIDAYNAKVARRGVFSDAWRRF